eukprot:6201952-Pleurochrysis_carterae.AAC.4
MAAKAGARDLSASAAAPTPGSSSEQAGAFSEPEPFESEGADSCSSARTSATDPAALKGTIACLRSCCTRCRLSCCIRLRSARRSPSAFG